MCNFFNKILDEEYIQIKVGYQKAIERFQQLPTLCEQKLSLGGTAAFNCKKNGIFEIGYGSKRVFERDPEVVGTCRIVGEIFLLNGKTVIKLRSCLKRFTLFLLLLTSFLSICTAVFLISYTIYIKQTEEKASAFRAYYMIFLLFLLIIVELYNLFYIYREYRHKTEDLQLMKKEALKRIEMVENWDK